MTIELHTDFITQRIGFGCGRLNGGSEKNASLRLIHTALDLGIRHFDTAPPYGLGASESVLGEALKGRQEDITIITKAGLPRPARPGFLQIARNITKPLATRIPGLREVILKGMSHRAQSGNFNPDFIAQSFETSLQLLQRDRVECLLLHEAPSGTDFSALHALLSEYVDKGQLISFGNSTGEKQDRLMHFGTVQQYLCPSPRDPKSSVAPTDILHGTLRFIAPTINMVMKQDKQLKDHLTSLLPAEADSRQASGALALAYALARFDNRLLISTNNAQRLISTVQQLDHIARQRHWQTAMQILHEALQLTNGFAAQT